MAERIHIAVTIEQQVWRSLLPDAARRVRHAARAALRAGLPDPGAAGLPRVELGVALADDARLRDLNARYRGIDRPTNVLSFGGEAPVVEIRSPNAPPLLLGDVVLARETVTREAAAQGKSLADHVTHLTVHGVLHLLGFDHETDADADAMEQLETRVLAGLGVADPYVAACESEGGR